MALPFRVAAIEISGDEVRVAVVKTGGRLPSVLELRSVRAIYDTPEERFEGLVRAVDAAVTELKSRPTAFVLCAATQFSVVRQLTIPFRGRRVAAAVPFELEPFLAFPIEELMVDYTVTGETKKETEVLAVGLRRDTVIEQLAVLDAAGISADAAGLDAAGITGLWVAAHKSPKGIHAVLHVRPEGAILTVVNHRVLSFFRHLPLTSAQLREQPALVAREIQNSLRGFLSKWRGDDAITKLHVTGVQLTMENRQQLEQLLQLEVEDELLLQKLSGPGLASAAAAGSMEGNYWEAAIGVALGAAGGSHAFDFKKNEYDLQRITRAVINHLVFSSCLALLGLVAVAYYYYHGAQKNRAYAGTIRDQITAVEAEVEALRGKGLPDVDADTLRSFSDSSLLDILQDIATAMPDGNILITQIQVNRPGSPGGWLVVQGEATDVATANQGVEKLRQSPHLVLRDDNEVRFVNNKAVFKIVAERPGDESEAEGGDAETTTR